MQTLRKQLHLPASPDEVWAWHAEPAAFDRLVPPWLDVEVVARYDRLEDGVRLVFETRRGPLGLAKIRWVARHENVRPGEGFVDVQEHGPFAHWRHEHRFEPATPSGGDERHGAGTGENSSCWWTTSSTSCRSAPCPSPLPAGWCAATSTACSTGATK